MEVVEVPSSSLAEGASWLGGIPMHPQTPLDVAGVDLSSRDDAAAIDYRFCVLRTPLPASLDRTCGPVVGRPD